MQLKLANQDETTQKASKLPIMPKLFNNTKVEHVKVTIHQAQTERKEIKKAHN
jgi:hypothetical protein